MQAVEWVSSVVPTWADPQLHLRKVVGRVLKAGPTPRHVGFIMDGNRRFARRCSIETMTAHSMGFETLKKVLEWCMELDVEVVTVYAFSIENFKRPKDEVANLMELAKAKFTELLEHSDLLKKYDICVRMLGDLTMLPEDVQIVLSRVVMETSNHSSHVLNVCMCYTAQEEMTRAIRDIAEGVKNNELLISDVTEDLIEDCLYTGPCPQLDMCIRTSGEVRLSDFLLWQNSMALLVFLQVMWPELSCWHVLYAFLQYSMKYEHLAASRTSNNKIKELDIDKLDRETAHRRLCSLHPPRRIDMPVDDTDNDNSGDINEEREAVLLCDQVNLLELERMQIKVRKEREERCRQFVTLLRARRFAALEKMGRPY